MRSRSTITAAFALAAATILAVAACGSSVTGSAQPNVVAAQTMTTPNVETSIPSELGDPTAIPTDLDAITSMLAELPPDLSVPSELDQLTALVPEGPCGAVSAAYGAALAAPFVGTADLDYYLGQLTDQSDIPEELLDDLEAIRQISSEAAANGENLYQLFTSEPFTTATTNISAWIDANC